MATELLGAVVNDVGNPILPVNNPAGEKAFYKLFFQTEIGEKLRPLLTDAVNDRVLEITTAKQSQGREITLDYFSQIIEDLLAVKDPSLFPAEEPESEVVDVRERNADGRFKSEFQVFSETHSGADCANRARVDVEYREWRRGQYRVEGIQEGAYHLAGAPLVEGTIENPARRFASSVVADFAKVYKSVPAHRLRARGGRVTMDESHSYTKQDFELLVSQAAEAGLL